jgi:membrane-bound lytic murein transglycosylase D
MSLVHKIPPMVSALAFGYGVGMSAPDSTLASVKEAVSVYHGTRPVETAPLVSAAPPPAPFRVPNPSAGGQESHELSRLREVLAREERDAHKAEACDLDRPSYSKPRYESRPDHLLDDSPDDLDSAGTEALSRLQLPDIRLSITRRTLKYVRFFTRTDRGRGMFETWLRRSGRYQELIEAELRERHLPEDLIWVSMIESGFDARARSPAGAVGLWQFMPATGEVYGLSQSKYLDQRKNPRLATQAAAHHLHDLYMRFGNWDLALAAYNMGYEQLLDSIDKYGTADFNELARQEAIPEETAAYVPKITAAAIVANNLEHFGFDRVEISRPVDSSEIAIPPGTPMKTIAKAAGISTASLRTLNPDILGERVPPGHGDYLVMIPADTLSHARASLPALLDTEPLVDDAAVLDPVDLLGSRQFTRRHARDEDESLLSLLPPARNRHSLRDPGAELATDDEPAARDEADEDADGPAEVSPHPRLLSHHARHRRQTVMYRVGPGDTMIAVARQFAMDIDDVARLNHLDTGDKLKVGSLLKLRVRPEMLDASAKDDGGKAAEPEATPKAHPRSDADGDAEPAHTPAKEKHAAGKKHHSPV